MLNEVRNELDVLEMILILMKYAIVEMKNRGAKYVEFLLASTFLYRKERWLGLQKKGSTFPGLC